MIRIANSGISIGLEPFSACFGAACIDARLLPQEPGYFLSRTRSRAGWATGRLNKAGSV